MGSLVDMVEFFLSDNNPNYVYVEPAALPIGEEILYPVGVAAVNSTTIGSGKYVGKRNFRGHPFSHVIATTPGDFFIYGGGDDEADVGLGWVGTDQEVYVSTSRYVGNAPLAGPASPSNGLEAPIVATTKNILFTVQNRVYAVVPFYEVSFAALTGTLNYVEFLGFDGSVYKRFVFPSPSQDADIYEYATTLLPGEHWISYHVHYVNGNVRAGKIFPTKNMLISV